MLWLVNGRTTKAQLVQFLVDGSIHVAETEEYKNYQCLLQKAKDELKSVLDEEDLGDVPILTGKDDDDDDDE